MSSKSDSDTVGSLPIELDAFSRAIEANYMLCISAFRKRDDEASHRLVFASATFLSLFIPVLILCIVDIVVKEWVPCCRRLPCHQCCPIHALTKSISQCCSSARLHNGQRRKLLLPQLLKVCPLLTQLCPALCDHAQRLRRAQAGLYFRVKTREHASEAVYETSPRLSLAVATVNRFYRACMRAVLCFCTECTTCLPSPHRRPGKSCRNHGQGFLVAPREASPSRCPGTSCRCTPPVFQQHQAQYGQFPRLDRYTRVTVA